VEILKLIQYAGDSIGRNVVIETGCSKQKHCDRLALSELLYELVNNAPKPAKVQKKALGYVPGELRGYVSRVNAVTARSCTIRLAP